MNHVFFCIILTLNSNTKFVLICYPMYVLDTSFMSFTKISSNIQNPIVLYKPSILSLPTIQKCNLL